MGNCVSCTQDKEAGDKKKYGGMDGNKKAGERVKNKENLVIDKSAWI